MDRKIIAVGGDWYGWEWYSLQQYSKSKAHFGLLSLDETQTFYERLEKRDCVPSHWVEGENAASWIRQQNIILLQLANVLQRQIFEKEEVVSALRDFWMSGGVILASGIAAGILFSEGLDKDGEVFSGWEFLQGSFAPSLPDHGSNYTKMVQSEKISSGYLVEKWSGVLYRGRHFAKALTLDETSIVSHVTKDGALKQPTELIFS